METTAGILSLTLGMQSDGFAQYFSFSGWLLLWSSSRRPPYSNTITRGFVLQVNNNRYAQLGDSLTFVRWP